MAGVAIAAMAISSCDEDTMNIGNTLTDDSDKLIMSTSSYLVRTQTIKADSVLSLSTKCYLGRVIDPETDTEVKSDFTTQFHVLENLYISPAEYLPKDTEGKVIADSCILRLYVTSPFNSDNNYTLMKMHVQELGTCIENGQKYYSNFDPQALVRKDKGALNVSHSFTYKNMTDTDDERGKSDYLDNIRINLNQAYTDKNGNTYSNYGTYILRKYFENKNNFSNSYLFNHEVCPGLFFEITDGLGFYAQVSDIGLHIYYKVTRPDTTYQASITLAGTKEVLQTTRITNDEAALDRLAKRTEHTYLKTPAGLFTEVTFPVDEIRANHTNDSLLSAKITFQRMNDSLSTDTRKLGTPKSLLMVQKDSLKTFFEKGKKLDGKTTYFCTFNSSYNTYSFSNVSNLITYMWEVKKAGEAADPQWVAKHPDWNKVVLVPITYTTTSTSSTPMNIEHDMSLTSTRLVGGNTPIQIDIVYGKFKDQQ